MSRIIEYRGKRYPRFWGSDSISLSEAMHRMGATRYESRSNYNITLRCNATDSPEGIEFFTVTLHADNGEAVIYKREIDHWLKERGLPECDDE